MTPEEMLAPIYEFLLCETPDEWVEVALQHPEIMLIDHCNCEKKAAGSAMTLMNRHIDNADLLYKMSKLAREELRHFEQVLAIMQKRGVEYKVVTGSRYAKELHKSVRKPYQEKLVDTLIIGALIEARSCERFAKIAPRLDEELEKFYVSLLKSESRHFRDYITLAGQYCDEASLQQRIDVFAELERELILSDDNEFRFHSGIPRL
ncbi:tRNA-(ms[2]io[6]A)-hydroxylase [Sinobacterium caligoides]|uniref:tRNA-(Ms[2]io[6]A)-hydroxylase n=1 Tax=Sinobacterium caligoides TaxID=933926 RepID=A0A3N2DXV1_9GAMM|nr:tRNA isopentenyl-2-thiomethyl-A-37 hydroxylase MiaE [Sinobacterium caligoides]ROS04661.1 tRNA-(ms[2]io[6]A)-hydroxylase [Sinobacterium caligoides]